MLEFSEIRKMFEIDREHSAEWRRQAYEDFEFVTGRGQWSDEDRRYLESKNRPVITFNRTAVIINSVAGSEIRNREDIRYFPVEEGDARPDEVLSEFANWFRQKSDASTVESDAFYDTLVCGMGWTWTTINYDDDPDGVPEMVHLDPLEMYWDAHARGKCLSDATRIWRARKMPLAEAMRLFPDVDPSKLNASWAQIDGVPETETEVKLRKYTEEGEVDSVDPDAEVTLIHLQIKEYEEKWRVADPITGKEVWLSDEEYETLQERMAELGMPFKGVKQERAVYRQYWIGSEILDDADIGASTFSYQCITGYRDHNSGTWHGLLHYMRDPQMWANKWLSQILHILNTMSKGGVMVELDAVEDMRKFKQTWAKNDEVTEIRPGGLQKVQPKPVQNVPSQLFSMMEYAVNSIRDVSGVNLEMLGQRGAIQAASLEESRKEASQTILSTLFDSLRKYRKEHGAVVLDYLKNFLNDGRLVRIAGEGNAKYVPLAVNQDLKYDIYIDESPQSPYLKERVWSFIAPILPQIPPQITAELLSYAPIPSSVAEKVQGLMRQMAQPDPTDQALKQIAVEKEMADVEMTKSAAMSRRADAEMRLAERDKKQADINLKAAQIAADLATKE